MLGIFKNRRVQALQTENRALTQLVIDALLNQNTESQSDVLQTAATEIAAGLYERAFMSATVSPVNNRTRALTPDVLGLIGRELVRKGEALFVIEIEGGRVMLYPAGAWDVTGGMNRDGWRYRAHIYGASRHVTKRLTWPGVVHVQFAFDPSRPWRGVAPLTYAKTTSRLVANTEQRLSQEAGSPVGNIIPIPDDPGQEGDDDPLDGLKSSLKNLKGNIALVETAADGWGNASQSIKNEYMPRRIGADPPQAFKELRVESILSLVQACGVPAALVDTEGGATASREAWRQFLFSTILPTSTRIAHEIGQKLGVPELSFSYEELQASDIASRARAFKAMVEGGKTPEEAAALSGLLLEEN